MVIFVRCQQTKHNIGGGNLVVNGVAEGETLKIVSTLIYKAARSKNKERHPVSLLKQGASRKSGGLLLSRIALQYHRRKRA